jgi:hypothetical protein
MRTRWCAFHILRCAELVTDLLWQLDRELVKQVLEVMMQPENMADVPYSPKVVQLLLREKVVSSNMLKSGLLPTLQRRRDWVSSSFGLRETQGNVFYRLLSASQCATC